MLSVSLLLVGITLISNGCLILQKTDAKSIALMNAMTAIVLIGGNFIQLSKAQTAMDYCNVGAGFLFGITYVIILCNLLFGLDPKANGWFSLMVAIFCIIMGISSINTGIFNYAYLWFTWSVLWASTFVEAIFKKPLGKIVPVLCILEGVFAAFIPSIMMFFEIW